MGDDEQDNDLSTQPTIADDVRAAVEQNEALAERLKEPVGETDAQRTERQRNERGQFVAHSAVETETAPAIKVPDAAQPDANIVQPSTAGEPPASWSADVKAQWSTLPPAIQAAVLKREREISDGGRQWSEQRQQFERVLTPVAELSRANGLSVEDGIQRLLTVERRLASDGPSMIKELAQAYGVDLAALVNGTQQPQRPAQQFDPNVLIQSLDQRLDARLQKWQSEQQQNAAVGQTISSFANEKTETGQLKHPHISNDTVRKRMSVLLSNEQAADLEAAYDMAVWSDPQLRQTLMAPAATQTRQKDQVTRSKAAAVSLKGAPNGGIKPNGSGAGNSVLDDVRAAVAELTH